MPQLRIGDDELALGLRRSGSDLAVLVDQLDSNEIDFATVDVICESSSVITVDRSGSDVDIPNKRPRDGVQLDRPSQPCIIEETMPIFLLSLLPFSDDMSRRDRLVGENIVNSNRNGTSSPGVTRPVKSASKGRYPPTCFVMSLSPR